MEMLMAHVIRALFVHGAQDFEDLRLYLCAEILDLDQALDRLMDLGMVRFSEENSKLSIAL